MGREDIQDCQAASSSNWNHAPVLTFCVSPMPIIEYNIIKKDQEPNVDQTRTSLPYVCVRGPRSRQSCFCSSLRSVTSLV